MHEHKANTEHSAPLRLNTVFTAVAGRLMCNVTPNEESSSSGRDMAFEAPPAYRKATPTKSGETSNAEQSQTDMTTDSPKRKEAEKNGVFTISGEEKDKQNGVFTISGEDKEKQNGVFTISGEAGCSSDPPNVNRNAPSTSEREARTSPSGSETARTVRSGHARTHAIVINLDDKSRFTEEVTV